MASICNSKMLTEFFNMENIDILCGKFYDKCN